MATSATLSALPSSFGATVIQANALLLQTGDYSFVDWKFVQKRVDQQGRSRFRGFPGGKVEDPNVLFLMRNDLTGVNSAVRTIVALWSLGMNERQSALNTSTMDQLDFATMSTIIRVGAWHYVDVTLSSGAKYNRPVASFLEYQMLNDPETGQLLPETNGYQRLHEALAFVLKPVAAGAPLWDPFYASSSGIMPV